MTRKARRLLSSLGYTALVAVVAALGYLTVVVASRETPPPPEIEGLAAPALIDVDAFSARLEQTAEGERLAVTVRLRLTRPGSLDCHVYFVARNDRVTPRLWAVWPPESAGTNVTGGGHFSGGAAPTGQPLSLGPAWTRVTGSLPHPRGRPPFETVVLYVVGRNGQVLLARPFAV